MSQTEEKSAEVMDKLYKSIAASMRTADEGCCTNLWTRPTICRVPESLRKLKPSAYTPHFVSIGPLHQNDPRLTAIQGHKFRYMHTFLVRAAKAAATDGDDADLPRVCLDAMFKVVSDARTCYGESLEYNDGELANTLLVDGCFILELLFRHKNSITDGNDPVFKNNLALGGIRRDLLLLGNQIPFFVLEKLFQLSRLQKHNNLSLTQYIHRFFSDMILFGSEMTQREGCDHILGFLHNYYWSAGTPGCVSVVKYSATQLHRTGVKFKARERKDYVRVRFRTWNLFSWLGRCNTRRESTSVEEGTSNHRISPPTSSIWNLFSRLSTLLLKLLASICCLFQLCGSACLELPPISVHHHTELFLRNLIAYEQCILFVPHYVTSYAFLMDTLIDSKDDVELLENQRVLRNHLGASEDASETIMGEFYFSNQWKELDKYCNLCWPKHLASLRSTYFSNPWAIISLIGAFLLFGLTAVQTAYSIKSYQFSLHSTNHT